MYMITYMIIHDICRQTPAKQNVSHGRSGVSESPKKQQDESKLKRLGFPLQALRPLRATFVICGAFERQSIYASINPGEIPE